MKLVKVFDLFDVKYGNSLELNRLKQTFAGINFISRTSKNNGVSAIVEPLEHIEPIPEGTITVSLGGSVLEAFLQPKPFYTGYHVFCLIPRIELTEEEKLFYCVCIAANRYRYNFGRQANKTLKDLLIPECSEIPNWTNKIPVHKYEHIDKSVIENIFLEINTKDWMYFKLSDLFTIKKGKRLTKAALIKGGNTPFISAIKENNGYREFINQEPIHSGKTITVNYNGSSVAETFYQPNPFWASDDVNVLYPKFEINPYIALFIVSLLKIEKYRFNYGRKWNIDRMEESEIRLPVNQNGDIDWNYIESYIKSLQYSSSI